MRTSLFRNTVAMLAVAGMLFVSCDRRKMRRADTRNYDMPQLTTETAAADNASSAAEIATLGTSGGSVVAETADANADMLGRSGTATPESGSLNSRTASMIKVEAVEGFSRTGTMSGVAKVRITNSSRYDLTLKSGTAVLCYSGSAVGYLVLDAPVSVARRTTASVSVPVSVKIGNIITAFAAYQKLKRHEIQNITLGFEGEVSAGNKSRTVQKSDIPLEKVLSAAGITMNDVDRYLDKVKIF